MKRAQLFLFYFLSHWWTQQITLLVKIIIIRNRICCSVKLRKKCLVILSGHVCQKQELLITTWTQVLQHLSQASQHCLWLFELLNFAIEFDQECIRSGGCGLQSRHKFQFVGRSSYYWLFMHQTAYRVTKRRPDTQRQMFFICHTMVNEVSYELWHRTDTLNHPHKTLRSLSQLIHHNMHPHNRAGND